MRDKNLVLYLFTWLPNASFWLAEAGLWAKP